MPRFTKTSSDECFFLTILSINDRVDMIVNRLTLKVLVATIDAQWEGMGEVGSARYEPTLLPRKPDHEGFKLQ